MSIKITCISDTHDQHQNIPLEPGDILLHAGDATMVGKKNKLESFVRWMAEQPFKHKIWIAGNHDWGMEFDKDAYEAWGSRRGYDTHKLAETRLYISHLCHSLGVTYLNNDGIEVEGLKIWGSPDQPAFCNWAFNRSSKFLKEHWEIIPDDTDILITHCPARGILDQLEDGDLVGDEALFQRIQKLKLKLHLCGHIHCGYGMVKVGDTTHVNASILDEGYTIMNNPITLEL